MSMTVREHNALLARIDKLEERCDLLMEGGRMTASIVNNQDKLNNLLLERIKKIEMALICT